MIRQFCLVCMLLCLGLSVSAQDELPLYDLPDSFNFPAFSSNSLVTLSNGRVATVNMLTDSVAVMDVRANELIVEIAVGDDPRSIDVTPDGTRLLVTNFGDDSLSVVDLESQTLIATYEIGTQPYAVITDNDESAFISLQGDNRVIEIELATGDILQDIPTPDMPTGLAIWGDFLYVTHFHSGQISLIYLPVADVVRTISTGDNSGLSQFIYVDHRNGLAYVPQSITYPDNPTPTFDRIIRPRILVIDLAQMRILRERTIWLDIADRPVNMPFSVVLNVAQGRLFVVNAGSADLSIIDLASGLAIEHTALSGNPRGITLSGDSTVLYVQSAVDSSVSIIETRFYSVTDTIPSTLNLPDLETQVGATLFHTANDVQVSGTAYLSCASCHFDGASDGRDWFGVSTSAFDELSDDFDLNNHIITSTYGDGFDEESSFELSALVNYMMSLRANP